MLTSFPCSEISLGISSIVFLAVQGICCIFLQNHISVSSFFIIGLLIVQVSPLLFLVTIDHSGKTPQFIHKHSPHTNWILHNCFSEIPWLNQVKLDFQECSPCSVHKLDFLICKETTHVL